MGKWVLVGFGVIVVSLAIAVIVGRARETTKVNRMVKTLIDRGSDPDVEVVDFDSFSDLPRPVARYFKHVLADDQGFHLFGKKLCIQNAYVLTDRKQILVFFLYLRCMFILG